jgi:5-methylcytosine-specific restriction enzyme A
LAGAVAGLAVNRATALPALYQPVTLLWAIGRVRRGETRVLRWDQTEQQLGELLRRHGGRGERPLPDYPVAALFRGSFVWHSRQH